MYSLPNVRCGSLPHQLIRSGACCRSGWFTGNPEVISSPVRLVPTNALLVRNRNESRHADLPDLDTNASVGSWRCHFKFVQPSRAKRIPHPRSHTGVKDKSVRREPKWNSSTDV